MTATAVRDAETNDLIPEDNLVKAPVASTGTSINFVCILEAASPTFN